MDASIQPAVDVPALSERIAVLRELALDLFWTWSHAGDAMWRKLDEDIWDKTRNPWYVLTHLPTSKLTAAANDAVFLELLDQLVEERRQYLERVSWFDQIAPGRPVPKGIAFFSMEFGLSEALPLYAGGLGILSGDYLKASSDLGIPMVGVGLLYQEGYFRQSVNADGEQIEAYPYNEPASLPIEPARTPKGGRLRVQIRLPGRMLSLRVWRANVGRVSLFLLDSNDLINSPVDRGITSKLYGGGPEMRFLQEVVLGIGGWRAIEALKLDIDVCHLNEGHCAMVVLGQMLSIMAQTGQSFGAALWAARAGNIFTTHTPVDAGFDRFSLEDGRTVPNVMKNLLADNDMDVADLIALGRRDACDQSEPFNMAYFALRGSAQVNAVSARHANVAKRLFHPLFTDWPAAEVPVCHVTNGAHTPSWDSIWADELWTTVCGKERWCDTTETLSGRITTLGDEQIWSFRTKQRMELIEKLRARVKRQKKPHLVSLQENSADALLDPNALMVGFARRFTDYKRPNLLLEDPDRFARILANPDRPVQIVVAGKAHPRDEQGQALIKEWIDFIGRPDICGRAIFIEDYNIGRAQELVAGVDVWINTPRPPMEACGTSGMKVLVNGGLNVSVLDGWWAEAFRDDVGWAVSGASDRQDADSLYDLFENEIVPGFYDRQDGGLPYGWIARVRTSMAALAPWFSSNRMARAYFEQMYCAAASAHRNRTHDIAANASGLNEWCQNLTTHWNQIHFGNVICNSVDQGRVVEIQIYFGEISIDQIVVELYADAKGGKDRFLADMNCAARIPGTENGYTYTCSVPDDRPLHHYTPRVRPFHEDAFLPLELPLVRWQK